MAVIYLPQNNNRNPYADSLWSTALQMALMKANANIRATEAQAERDYDTKVRNEEGNVKMRTSGYSPVREMSIEHAELDKSGGAIEGYGRVWKKDPQESETPQVHQLNINGMPYNAVNMGGTWKLVEPPGAEKLDTAYKLGELKEMDMGNGATKWLRYVGGNKTQRIPGTNRVTMPGWEVTDFGKVPEQKFTDDAKSLAEQNKNAGPLRKEFIGQAKDYVTVRDSYARVQAASNEPSAAGDLALIFNYMKILDPGSVVRESEFANAASSGAFGERLKAAANKILKGERLSDEMRQDFVDRAKRLYKKQEESHMKLRDEYDRISTGLGVEPSSVIIDYLPKIIEEEQKQESAKKDLADKYGVTLGDY